VNIVLDAATAKIEHRSLERRHPTLQRPLRRGRGLIIRPERAGPAASCRRAFTGNLPIQLLNPRSQAEHVGMLGLHEGALVLIFGFQRRSRLSQRLGVLGRVQGSREAGRAIGALGGDPARGGLGQSPVQSDQRLPLDGIGIGRNRPCLSAADVDDALRLGIGYQLPFRTLQVGPGFPDLPFQEVAGIGGRLVAALEARIDEAFRHLVGDRRRQLRRFGVHAERDQLALLRHFDIQAVGNLVGCDLQPRRRIAAFANELPVVGQVEILGRAFGDAPARQQANLGCDMVPGRDWRSGLFTALLVHDLDRRRIDLQRHFRPIDRRGQQCDDDRPEQAEGGRANDQPAPVGNDPD
jgi:hypothetical protein